MNPETMSPHLHPLNQAARLVLRRVSGVREDDRRMPVIQLAMHAVSNEAGHPLPGERSIVLTEWNLPKWRMRALRRLERRMTAKQLLMLGTVEAGRMIAEILLERSPRPWALTPPWRRIYRGT